MLEATLSVPHSAPCWLGRVTGQRTWYVTRALSLSTMGCLRKRRSSTREVSDKVRPHWSVGKLVEVSSKDNTRVGNMGEVRD